jgi:hypothetical protein
MPLRNEFSSIAAIAPILRQPAKPEVIPLPSPSAAAQARALPNIHARLGETIGERIVVVEALPQSAAAWRSPAASLADRKR